MITKPNCVQTRHFQPTLGFGVYLFPHNTYTLRQQPPPPPPIMTLHTTTRTHAPFKPNRAKQHNALLAAAAVFRAEAQKPSIADPTIVLVARLKVYEEWAKIAKTTDAALRKHIQHLEAERPALIRQMKAQYRQAVQDKFAAMAVTETARVKVVADHIAMVTVDRLKVRFRQALRARFAAAAPPL
jgi:transketolase